MSLFFKIKDWKNISDEKEYEHDVNQLWFSTPKGLADKNDQDEP